MTQIDQSPCDVMKPVVKSWEKFRDSSVGKAIISAAPTVCAVAVVLLLTCGIKMTHTITSEQNKCVQAQIEAGVPKTNPVQMGCV